MARSNVLSLIAVCCLLFFGSTMSLAASSPDSSLTLSTPNEHGNPANASQLPSGERTWYWISGDGSQIVPINGPEDEAKNMTAPSGLPATANGNSYTFSFGNYHGATTLRPGLAKFLFDCEFRLFDQIPASRPFVWTPYPQGKYFCAGDLPGIVRLSLIRNNLGWDMAFHDVAFLIKLVHDIQGVRDEVHFFDFVVSYTNNPDRRGYETVVYGKWERVDGNTAAATS